MIDPTPQLSRTYSDLIERPGVSQDEIDYKALQILRGLSPLDISDALYDSCEELRMAVAQNIRVDVIGEIVQRALLDYCQRIAVRELEA